MVKSILVNLQCAQKNCTIKKKILKINAAYLELHTCISRLKNSHYFVSNDPGQNYFAPPPLYAIFEMATPQTTYPI